MEASLGKMLPSAFSNSYFRYRGFDAVSIGAGPFVDLSAYSGVPWNLQVGISGGMAFGYYRETSALFFFPLVEPSCTIHKSSPKMRLIFSGSASIPFYLKPQALSIGLGLRFGIGFMPFVRTTASGDLP